MQPGASIPTLGVWVQLCVSILTLGIWVQLCVPIPMPGIWVQPVTPIPIPIPGFWVQPGVPTPMPGVFQPVFPPGAQGLDGRGDKQGRTAHVTPRELIRERGRRAGQTSAGIASPALIKLEIAPGTQTASVNRERR